MGLIVFTGVTMGMRQRMPARPPDTTADQAG
jgi:hypothetical protein